MGIIKTFQTQMTDFDIDATADCPSITFALAGKTETEGAALAADITAWSDGYNMTVTQTMSADYFASMATDAELQLAFGDGAELAAAENGAYNLTLVWSYDSSNSNCDATNAMAGFYLPVASVTADLDNGSTGVVDMYYYDTSSSNASTDAKYGWTATPSFTGSDDIAADTAVTAFFYMPTEADVDAETTATGDRIDSGDKLGVFAGAGTPTAECDDGLKVKLGAVTLAAGATALAAALAF